MHIGNIFRLLNILEKELTNESMNNLSSSEITKLQSYLFRLANSLSHSNRKALLGNSDLNDVESETNQGKDVVRSGNMQKTEGGSIEDTLRQLRHPLKQYENKARKNINKINKDVDRIKVQVAKDIMEIQDYQSQM